MKQMGKSGNYHNSENNEDNLLWAYDASQKNPITPVILHCILEGRQGLGVI